MIVTAKFTRHPGETRCYAMTKTILDFYVPYNSVALSGIVETISDDKFC